VGRRQPPHNREEMTVGTHLVDKYVMNSSTSEEQLSSNARV